MQSLFRLCGGQDEAETAVSFVPHGEVGPPLIVEQIEENTVFHVGFAGFEMVYMLTAYRNQQGIDEFDDDVVKDHLSIRGVQALSALRENVRGIDDMPEL